MSELNIPQTEADLLLAMEKHADQKTRFTFPDYGSGYLEIPLEAPNKREKFSLDISRARIDLKKCKFQNRARQVIVLVRLEIEGPPHRNPDGEVIQVPHIHIYKENYGAKWAYPIRTEDFSNIDDFFQTLSDFQRYCNITRPPKIDKSLFS